MKKLITIILSLSLSIFLLSLAVKGTLAFRQLYFYDLDHLNIATDYGMKKEEIMKNYNILIDYIQDKKITKLSMPSFKMSREGEIHFKEVKDIFMKFNTLMYICGVLSLIGIIYMTKIKNFLFLKFSSIMLIVIPVFLSIPFAINFDKSFTAFHKLFFTNDYWEFDPVRDPIINVLPQEFFFHCAVMILALIALFSFILYFTYRKTKKISRA
ncbi:TIGR01906 family membrane protein [Clostridium sp. YIM B02515]|uniref:TIGR01906 family membrane protein n=1 Tax=Clostridium rhizosphaerae TaxID=2803861 RepID=A0ABS1TD95_9CLOT|nr:TIGR01906 family membrane protein [Clostridium rhizosphaerae]MBL4937211.1 TIGR01906 family membrane protein [Clostridium rhizosphaerae]